MWCGWRRQADGSVCVSPPLIHPELLVRCLVLRLGSTQAQVCVSGHMRVRVCGGCCPAGDEQQLLLDVDASGVASALQWLNRYKLRRKLQLEDVSSRLAVWAAFEGYLQAGTSGAHCR